jgi:hypothetical protein
LWAEQVELVRAVNPATVAGDYDPDVEELDALAAKLLPRDYNRVTNRPPPSALSYNSVVYAPGRGPPPPPAVCVSGVCE